MDVIPYYEAAYTQKITVHFDTAGVGGRFCGPLKGRQSGPGLAADPLATGDGGNYKVDGTPAAGGEVGGLIMRDVAIGAKGGIIRGAGTVVPCESGAAIAVGAELAVDVDGRVNLATVGQRLVGKAHSAVAGAGLVVEVELYSVPSRQLAA